MTAATAEVTWFLDNRVEFLSVTDDHALLAISGHPGDVVPLHRHDEDEVFAVLEGELTLILDGATIVLEAGRSLTAPRDVPHAYRVTSDTPARWLGMTVPGRFGAFVRELSRPAEDDGLPTPGGPPSDEAIGVLTETAARHGIEILGPPPSEH